MEAIKSYRIPVDAPKDLIDSYFEAKRRALEAVLNHVKFNRKAHLDFKNDDICSTRDPFFPVRWMHRYLSPWYNRIWKELKSKGIIVLFCTDSDITPIIDDIAEAGADGFIIEECSNLNFTAENYGNNKVIIGDVDIGKLTYGYNK